MRLPFLRLLATCALTATVSVFLGLAALSCEPTGPDNGDDTDTTGGDDTTALQADSYETNDTWQEAGSISLDSEISANIHEAEDVDFYRFTTAHPANTYDKIRIALSAGDADLLLHLELYDTLGQKRTGTTAETPGQNLTYTLACPGGTYILRVSGWNKIMNRDNGSFGAYSATVTNLDVNDSLAPNHSREEAAEVAFGTDYQGVLVSKYEDDWFHVANPDSGTWEQYTVSLTDVSAELARNIAVYNDDGDEIHHNDGAALVVGKGTPLTYTFISKDPGTYVWVYGWDNIMHSPHGSSGSYTFRIDDNDANDDNEPDDTFADARVIDQVPATPLSGTILTDAANDNGGDFEFFKVSLPDGKKALWEVDPAASDTELHFKVYNAEQSYLGNEDGSDGETISGSMNNNSGSDTFFFISLGAFVGDNGDYTITFTQTVAD